MAAKPVPDDYTSISFYPAVDDAARAIDFYVKAFGAKERGRMPGPDGKIAHAELQIGDTVVMLSDPFRSQASSHRRSSAGPASRDSCTSRTSTPSSRRPSGRVPK